MWGISKHQFKRFVSEARAAHLAGEIPNINGHDPTAPDYYPADKFDSLDVGPSMHQATTPPPHSPTPPHPEVRAPARFQVVKSFIKPLTACFARLPGASYAIMRNLWSGGLHCSLFLSHACTPARFELPIS